MQTVTISFFRFDGVAEQAWAFSRMQFARGPLAALPGVGFWKLFGTGTRESFHPRPNFGVYAILACWPDLDHAREQIAGAEILQRYRDHAADHWTVFLEPLHSWGLWDATEPFRVPDPPSVPASSRSTASDHRPLGVLTRATVRYRALPAFWRSVPAISDMTAGRDGLLFKMGMGEFPWVQQVTFSAWEDMRAMRGFAYRNGPHKDAIKAAREKAWFKEELFARFAIRDHVGTWGGADPLAGSRPPLGAGIAAE